MDSLKNTIAGLLGITGGGICAIFGGWDSGVLALFVVMLCDFVAGLIAVCAFGGNRKAETSATKWEAINKDFFRKMTILSFVLVGHVLDLYLGTSFLRDSIVIGFLCLELVSFADNATIIGVPTPSVFRDIMDALHKAPKFKERGKKTKNGTGGK